MIKRAHFYNAIARLNSKIVHLSHFRFNIQIYVILQYSFVCSHDLISVHIAVYCCRGIVFDLSICLILDMLHLNEAVGQH